VEKSSWKCESDDVITAFQQWVTTMEIDIRLNKDWTFYVLHSPKFHWTYIHELTDYEIYLNDLWVTTLEEVLKVLQKYKTNWHKLILELKTIYSSIEDDGIHNLKHLKELLVKYDVLDNNIIIATLSPDILMKVDKIIPEVPVIMNWLIAPIISYWKVYKFNRFLKHIKIGTKNLNTVITTGNTLLEYSNASSDWLGKHNSYIITELPKEMMDVLKKKWNYIWVSGVVMVTNILRVVFLNKIADRILRYYVDTFHTWWFNIQLTTRQWGIIKPTVQIKIFEKAGLWEQDIIYSKDVSNIALQL
jgi:glycerophosphoryl diester phosphodiesterase